LAGARSVMMVGSGSSIADTCIRTLYSVLVWGIIVSLIDTSACTSTDYYVCR
jgi:hypothetical protein